MTKTRKITDYRQTDEKGQPLPAYEVVVDGETIGMVWKLRKRYTHTGSTNIAVGASYATEWRWSETVTATFPKFDRYVGMKSKTAAVAKLVEQVGR